MTRFGWLIGRYLIQAVLPYFLFSWLLLTVILFVQQASRYADIFFSVNIPAQLVWQLTLALVPNVIAFTCPMAVLVGTIIGLSKMQKDSELVAVRAAGVANWQIMIPIICLGGLLSIFAFLVNVKGVPFAAGIVRRVALQTAIKKLESPIEPGVFNTEVAGYTIYVRGGDIETGRWKGIFIYSNDPKAGEVRLITSGQGRVDVTDENSELVLSNAHSYTFPPAFGDGKFIAESIGELRLAIKTKRNELIQRLASAEVTPEELGLSQLNEYASTREGKDRTEAEILWQRRILLSITPLIFCVLGTSMMLRFNRGGRGFGVFLALIGLIAYYLLAFLGEQLARTGLISVLVGGALPVAFTVLVLTWFSFSGRMRLRLPSYVQIKAYISGYNSPRSRAAKRAFLDLSTGLLDIDLVTNLLKFFFISLGFLSAIFIIFTAFELWKFAGNMDGGVWLLTKYLFFLLPFVYIQLAPSAAMIAILATYVIKSRQNEIVTWTAAGRSIYRLLFPCFLLMVLLGLSNWQVQEWILPRANRTQERLRNQIRSLGIPKSTDGQSWFATNNRIYSFERASITVVRDQTGPSGIPQKPTEFKLASDNENTVRDVKIFEFSDNGELQTVYRLPSANWKNGSINFNGTGEKSVVKQGSLFTERLSEPAIRELFNPFVGIQLKPSQMNALELQKAIDLSTSEVEAISLGVALQKRYASLAIPFVIAIFTAPFSLTLGRRNRVVTVGYAIGLWLVFTAAVGVFEQFGLSGSIDPKVSAWGPLALFSVFGLFLLTKVRT